MGEVPKDWKKAKVTLVFKNGKKENLGNCMSVNLTTIPRNMMDQLILETISKYIKDRNVTGSSQHGFMKGKPCLINLIVFSDELIGFVDNGKSVDIVYLDFSKVFKCC